MTIEQALRDAVVKAELELHAAIARALPGEPDIDPRVQHWSGSIAAWRAALGDPPGAIADDYERAVEEVVSQGSRLWGRTGS